MIYLKDGTKVTKLAGNEVQDNFKIEVEGREVEYASYPRSMDMTEKQFCDFYFEEEVEA